MSEARTFLYFGYGSNMPSVRIKRRCPSAKFVGVGELKNRRLVWNNESSGKSKEYGTAAECKSAKCNIVRDPDAIVYGAVYEIPLKERSKLRRAEGYQEKHNNAKSVYLEQDIEILLNGESQKAKVYIGNKQAEEGLKPFDWYREHVLRGAREHKLPEDYINQYIEGIPAQDDPCERRRQDELAIYK